MKYFQLIFNLLFSLAIMLICSPKAFSQAETQNPSFPFWKVNGNSGTIDGTHFIGTTDNIPLNLRVNNQKAGRVDNTNHNVSLGYQSISSITSATSITAVGDSTLYSNTTGIENTAFGSRALRRNIGGGSNTGIGVLSLHFNTAGSLNTGIGHSSLYTNTTGNSNIAMGAYALYSNVTGSSNLAAGVSALNNNSTGSSNVALGANALYNNSTASWNTATGHTSLFTVTTGQYNTANGGRALYNTTNSNGNTALGYQAGLTNTNGPRNTFLGYNSDALTNGLTNAIAVGANAQVNTSNSMVLGSVNGINGGTATMKVAIGNNSPVANLDITGDIALRSANLVLTNGSNNDVNTITNENSFYRITGPASPFTISGFTGGVDGRIITLFNATNVGCTILNSTTSVAANQILTSNGSIALSDSGTITFQYNATELKWIVVSFCNGNYVSSLVFTDWSLTGNSGTVDGTNFIGTTDNIPFSIRVNNQRAGRIDPILSNTFYGYWAGRDNSSGTQNTAVGINALLKTTSGNRNTAHGTAALEENITGNDNTGIGHNSLYYSTGNRNTAGGAYSLATNTSADDNTAFGYGALYANTIGINNTAIGASSFNANINGGNNTAIGVSSLQANTTGSYNTVVGAYSNNAGSNLSNTVAIGYNVNVDVSNKAVVGNTSTTSIGGQVGWTTFSDQRVKQAIQNNVPGLSFINLLKPVTYRYNIDEENKLLGIRIDTAEWQGKHAVEQMIFSGFIAQQVDSVAQSIGYNFSGLDKSGKILGLRYAEFVAPLVKGMQEQQRMIDILNFKNSELLKRIEQLEQNIHH